MCTGAASVMAPAVANPLYMGYKALYRTILEDSKRGIAKAMRVFCDPDNLPVLIHCIHGGVSFHCHDLLTLMSSMSIPTPHHTHHTAVGCRDNCSRTDGQLFHC